MISRLLLRLVPRPRAPGACGARVFVYAWVLVGASGGGGALGGGPGQVQHYGVVTIHAGLQEPRAGDHPEKDRLQ